MKTSTLLAMVAGAMLLAPAIEADAQYYYISGKKLIVKDKDGDATKRKIVFMSKDATIAVPTPSGIGDPTLGGAVLRVMNPVTLEDEVISLPSSGWTGMGKPAGSKGYKYIDKTLTNGPCKIVLVKAGKIKAVCKGNQIGFSLDESSQGLLGTTVTLGSDQPFCAEFGGTIKKDTPAQSGKVGQFNAKDAPAPLTCPVPTTTTTTTTTSTTTTTTSTTSTTTSTTTTTTSTTTTTTSTTTTTTSTTTTTTSSTTSTTSTTLPPPPLDHYRLYPGQGHIDPPLVNLVDQFQEQDVDPNVAHWFMPPVEKVPEGVFDPIPHLTCYPITGTFAASVDVNNQFGPQTLDVEEPVALCVPTEKLEPPTPGDVVRDHYKCYEAFGPAPGVAPVHLVDQFWEDIDVLVLEPIWFCNPVDKNDEGILNYEEHLTCYLTDSLTPPAGLVTITNQFGLDTLSLESPFALCVPSEKLGWTPVTTTTTTTSTTTTTTTTTLPAQDHFTLYEATGLLLPPQTVNLIDQFGEENPLLEFVSWFMPPVVKTPPGIPLVNPGNHLTCYQISGDVFGPAAVTVLNQFGEQSLTVNDPMALCVPSDKTDPDDGLLPDPSDHYKCYDASGLPVNQTVTLLDQFQEQLGVLVTFPELFCNPVDKDGEGIIDPDTHLTCYTIPWSPWSLTIGVNNQFGPHAFDIVQAWDLCVPSEKLSWHLLP